MTPEHISALKYAIQRYDDRWEIGEEISKTTRKIEDIEHRLEDGETLHADEQSELEELKESLAIQNEQYDFAEGMLKLMNEAIDFFENIIAQGSQAEVTPATEDVAPSEER